jgi:hypothetical protein
MIGQSDARRAAKSRVKWPDFPGDNDGCTPREESRMASAALVHDYQCPEGHSTRLAWDPVQLLSVLDEGPLALCCARCKTARPATEEERAGLRRLAALAAGRAVIDCASNDPW